MMIKEWLMNAADHVFTFICAVLMRRAVARLARMPDDALADAGLSRAAVAAFLAAPLGTDPGSFFARRSEQSEHRLSADPGMIPPSPPTPLPARRHADGAIDYNFYRARAARLRRQAIRNVIARIDALRLRAVAAGLIVVLRALNGRAARGPDRTTVAVQHVLVTDHGPVGISPRALPGAMRTTAPAYVVARAGHSGIPRLSVALAQDALHPDARDGPASRRDRLSVSAIDHASRKGRSS